jgi:acyl-CoA synthetase (AMP-forming)/AMP-acid ligase II
VFRRARLLVTPPAARGGTQPDAPGNAATEVEFVDGLGEHGDRLALQPADGVAISYRELDQRVAEVADRLGPVRRLVLLAASNDVDSIVAYLAALRGRHPVLLADHGQVEALAAAYDPDLVIDRGWYERRTGSMHELHPELALLLSTSGSTGSPKLVRLSRDNLRSNATAIAEYLDIRPTDRAITSLPTHYCYGLSVINSNLLRGAGLVLTDRSVSDPAFWAAVREHDVTSLHGVPHTFELLDRVGFAGMALPSLRYVTQAGGRLDPAAVARFATLGEERGWRFFVMYGQTEATARMAYLPPDLAREHPSAIGVPVSGGEFTIVDGELVYRGPNVMLGYARSPADLALGRCTDKLRTGDLGRRTPDGLYEVTGRIARFRKLFGLRVDLDQVERLLADAGIPAACAGTDQALVIAVLAEPQRAAELAGTHLGLPPGSLLVYRVDAFPLLANGKIDYSTVTQLGNAGANQPAGSVRQVFAAVLGLSGGGSADIPDDASFVDLGGDSLRYVQASRELERLLGPLPPQWPSLTVAELEHRERRPYRVPMLETSIVLRAVAILLVVGSHVALFELLGGAHLLLVIAGWNFAQFLLPPHADRTLSRRMVRSAALVAVPSIGWLAYRAAVTEDVTIANAALVSTMLWTGTEGYWFIEVLVHTLLGLALLFTVPVLGRLERAHRFPFALAALGVALMVNAAIDDSASWVMHNMSVLGAAWFFVLGWLAHRADTAAKKALVVALAVAFIPGTFGQPVRESVVLVGLMVLVALARVPVPEPLAWGLSRVANASLAIYLTHYAVFPVFAEFLPPAPVLMVTLIAGVLAWWAMNALARWSLRVGQDDTRPANTASKWRFNTRFTRRHGRAQRCPRSTVTPQRA